MGDSDIQKRLMAKAGRLLGRRSYSTGEIAEKLSKMAGEEDVRNVLTRLQELHLLNDDQYAYNFAANHMKQDGWGPRKVYHCLLRHRIAPSVADEAINRAQGEASETLILEQYLDRYCGKHGWPADRKGVERLVAHLRRRGFHMRTIEPVLAARISAARRSLDAGE